MLHGPVEGKHNLNQLQKGKAEKNDLSEALALIIYDGMCFYSTRGLINENIENIVRSEGMLR